MTAPFAPSDHNAASVAATLPKALAARHVAMISIGGIIGSGLFVGSSAAIAATGPVILVSYLLAGIIMLFVMRMLAEMVIATPGLGSFTEYVRLGLGDWAGFTTGWLYWGFWVLAIALESLAGATILSLYVVVPTWLIGLLLLALLTIVNSLSARSYGEAEFWLSVLKIVAIVAFIAIGSVYLWRASARPGAVLSNLFSHGGFAPFGPLSVFSGVTAVVLALVGAEIVTIAAAESNTPTQAIARMTTSLIVRISLFYLASMFIIVAVVPWTDIRAGDSPFAIALGVMRIPWAPEILNAVVVVAVLSCLNSGVYVSSRVLFKLAARGEAPAWLAATDRREVPMRAILLGSACAALVIATSMISAQFIFAFLVNACGAVMLVIYLLLAIAQVRRRHMLERSGSMQLTLKTWMFPWSSYVVIGSIAAILLAMLLTPALASQVWASLTCTALACVAYALRRSVARISGKEPRCTSAAR